MTDLIDLATVRVLNSPDIHAWPATTDITRLELRPTGVHVEFTKRDGPDRWPDVPFGDPAQHGSLQFTLWIVLQIGFQWFAAGCIDFWFGLDESGGPVTDYAANWYYDAGRWAPMTGHQPAVGERVGFLITSGDARHGDDAVGLHERSQIVAIAFPDAAGDVFTFDASPPVPEPVPVPLPPAPPAPVPPAPPAPAPVPTPPPLQWAWARATPAPTPAPLPGDLVLQLIRELIAVGGEISSAVDALGDRLDGFEVKIDALLKDGVRVHL